MMVGMLLPFHFFCTVKRLHAIDLPKEAGGSLPSLRHPSHLRDALNRRAEMKCHRNPGH